MKHWRHEMVDDLTARVLSFLDKNHVMSLATLGPDGPHAANVFYARDGIALFWMSDPQSRHSAHVGACGRVAVTVAPDCRDFLEIQGLQIVGVARSVTNGRERARAFHCLSAKYPFLTAPDRQSEGLRSASVRACVYRLDPTRITLIDNVRGFGHKETLNLASDRHPRSNRG